MTFNGAGVQRSAVR
ncbi:hypothetical protein ACLK1T_10850 [Escherichia coli]